MYMWDKLKRLYALSLTTQERQASMMVEGEGALADNGAFPPTNGGSEERKDAAGPAPPNKPSS